MHSIDATIIEDIRNRKRGGESLKQISKELGIAKSTASLYCRDLFEYRGRKYQTEKEARQIPIQNRKGKPRKKYPSDYKKYPRQHGKRKLYPCRNGCGNMITRNGSLCIQCYNKKRIELANIRAKERELRIKENIKRLPPIKVEICNASPNERHYWLINSDNFGVCKWCKEERQF